MVPKSRKKIHSGTVNDWLPFFSVRHCCMSNESMRSCGVTRNVDFVNQISHHFKNSVIQQMSSSSIKFNIINITVSTTYFLHPRLPYSATISGADHTLSCFRNTVDTLSSLKYYTETFIDAIMKLSTHSLNHGLTVIIVNHLALCQAWSVNEYVMLSYQFFTVK